VSLQILYEEQAINQAAGFLTDDPEGLAGVWTLSTTWSTTLARPPHFPTDLRTYAGYASAATACCMRSKAMSCRSGTSHAGRPAADPPRPRPSINAGHSIRPRFPQAYWDTPATRQAAGTSHKNLTSLQVSDIRCFFGQDYRDARYPAAHPLPRRIVGLGLEVLRRQCTKDVV
jgi:hypothetical protein